MSEVTNALEPEELGVVGEDLTEDTSGLLEDEAAPMSQQSGVSEEFDPHSVNWSTVREEEVPDEWKPQLRTMRNIYGMVNKTNMDLRDTQKQMEEVTQQYTNALNATQQINQAQNPTLQQEGQPAQQQTPQSSVLEHFGFSPGSNGYDEAVVVEGIANAVVTPLLNQVQALQQDLGQLHQNVQYLSGNEQGRVEDKVSGEIQEAINAGHSREALQDYHEEISKFRGMTNRETGQPHTVRTAYELASGRRSEHSEDSRSLIRNAQQSVAPRGGGIGQSTDNSLSETEVLSGLKKLGFE
jgi:small-conductance mechanosensitive channel